MKLETTIGKYRILRNKIGKGAFSKIYKGISNNKEVAIKIIKKKNIKNEKLIKREIQVLQQLNHENVIQLLDVMTTNNRYYLIFNFCKYGDLKNYIYNENTNMNETEIQALMIQLQSGLQYLYTQNIVHRDLKPQNILVTDEHIIKISDFGFAKIYKDNTMTQTVCGSPLYMAPEILHYKKYTQLADLWSVGVILYEILFKVTPIKGNNLYELVSNIKKYNYKNDPLLLNQSIWSEPVIKLIKQLLEKNPKKRITWELFFNHEWFNYKINETQEINKQDDYIFLMDEDNSVIYNSKLTISDNYLDTQLSLSDEKQDSQYLIVSNTKKISSIPRSMPKNRFTNMITSLGNSLSLLFTSPNSI